MLKFRKMHGLGNDFAVLDCRDGGTPVLDTAHVPVLADRRRGIGFDQIVHMLPPKEAQADVFLDMYNADGSTLEACGNATRCIAKILMEEKGTDRCTIQTVAGLLECQREEDGWITADMGVPRLDWQDIPLAYDCDTLYLPLDLPSPSLSGKDGVEADPEKKDHLPVGVNIGNPHAVFFVGDVEDFPVQDFGRIFEHDSLFPQRANIEFAKVLDRGRIRLRVWERGTGETEACGSAACATVVAAVRRGYADRMCDVILNGGTLKLHWREEDGHILMTGTGSACL